MSLFVPKNITVSLSNADRVRVDTLINFLTHVVNNKTLVITINLVDRNRDDIKKN
jgi:hypothetical protein